MKPLAELNVGELGFLDVVIVIVGRFELPSEEKFIVAKMKKKMNKIYFAFFLHIKLIFKQNDAFQNQELNQKKKKHHTFQKVRKLIFIYEVVIESNLMFWSYRFAVADD